MDRLLHIGLDIGSTTVKLVALDSNCNLLYSRYERHYSDIKKTILDLITEAYDIFNNDNITINITGSGGFAVAKCLKVPFIQEVTLQ